MTKSKRGKTIEIYLYGGDPKGIRECNIKGGAMKAVFIPRSQIKDAKIKDKLTRPSVYFLFAKQEEETLRPRIYVGETEITKGRLDKHLGKKKNFYWNYAVCFISASNSINKAHVKFLEAKCYKELVNINRADIHNTQEPRKPRLTKQEEDFSEDMLDEIKILVGALGYSVFEPIKKETSREDIFVYGCKNAKAKGSLTDSGFIVYKGSTANINETQSAGESLTNLRIKLQDKGVLEEKDEILVFTKDYEFNSPSKAAGVILAGRVNGWEAWKNKGGKTLNEVRR